MRVALRVALAATALSLSGVAVARPIPSGVEEATASGRITVVALTDNIVRIRLSRRDGAMPEDASWAVPAQVRAQRANVRQDAHGFATSRLSVSVDPATLSLTVRDAQGRIVVADAAPVARSGDGFAIRKLMPTGQRIVGMGDKTGGVDRAGKTFVNWNTDAYGFDAASDPIYKAIPFYIAQGGGATYGLFLDNSFRTSFDFGHREAGTVEIAAPDGPVDYYIIVGETLRDVTRGYASLTGKAPLPPKWALGYQQSRYSYMSSNEVRDLVARFEAERFPVDVVWLDIDYQDRNRPFTVNRKTFPDFEPLIGALAAKGIRTVPIVDLHVAAAPNEGYVPYDSGIAGDHFIRKADGSLYVAPVWPGPSVFPDFTRKVTRDWWGGLFKPLVDAGAAGIWNDMNEPAVFDTPSKTMPLDNLDRIASDDFAPRTTSQAEIHNILGMQNSRATHDGLLALRPNVRPFVMTRASYAGGQRYAVTWTGDNSSTWDHLKLAVAQQLNLGLSGFTWSGADVGGFTGGPSPELLTRWMQYGAFSPIFRNHSANGAPHTEPWLDGPQHLAIRKAYVEERYRLMPYFYAVAADSARDGDPWMRPIDYDYPGATMRCDASMSYAIGDRLIVSGEPNPSGRWTYTACLPSTVGWYDYWTGKPVDMSKPLIIEGRLDRLPLFVRAGTILPKQPVVPNTAARPAGPLELHIYPGPNCSGELYDDDGVHISGPSRRQTMRCSTDADGRVAVMFDRAQGRFKAWWKSIKLIVHGEKGERSMTIPASDKARTVLVPAG